MKITDEMVRLVAEWQIEKDQRSAANTGHDIMLAIDPYFPWARELLEVALSAQPQQLANSKFRTVWYLIKRVSEQKIWRDTYPDGPDIMDGQLSISPQDVRACRSALASAQPQTVAPFQNRVRPWMMACFGPEISADKLERGDRLLEEVFELLQSGDYPRDRIRALENYTWSRPKGEPRQEVGGVMVTLAAYCLAHDLDMHEAGEAELARIWTKVEKIRAKQAAKPTGSALPVAVAIPPDQSARIAELEAELRDANSDRCYHDDEDPSCKLEFVFMKRINDLENALSTEMKNNADRVARLLNSELADAGILGVSTDILHDALSRVLPTVFANAALKRKGE